MTRHLVLLSNGGKIETDVDPTEEGSFLVVQNGEYLHRIPLVNIRDWIQLSGTPTPPPTGNGRLAASVPEPVGDPGAGLGTPPSPPRDADAIPSNVGQVKNSERPLPSGHPALNGGTQMIEIGGRMVPVSDEGLPPGDTENL